MMNNEPCDRCEGSGVDPRQAYFDDEIGLCLECRGDGVLVTVIERASGAADGRGAIDRRELAGRVAA
ncbi:MAG: hypothetical protein Q7T71_20790 [Herbiconiux sp.]|nr:hypothetical protein [Herbiconiux sp.]